MPRRRVGQAPSPRRTGHGPRATATPTNRPADTRPWWTITNAADDINARVDIHGEIDPWAYSAETLIAELRDLQGQPLDVHLSSPGGDVFDGLLIYQTLIDHQAEVTVYIDSLAASIASVIAQAGNRVVIAGNAQMMIHDAIGWCNGQAADMRQTADLLDRASDNIASIYATRTGKGGPKSWRKAMVADGLMGTWMDADEAVAAGLADEVSKAGSRNAADVTPLRPEPPRTEVTTTRLAACAQILDRIEAAFDEDSDDDDEVEHAEDCARPADGCDCPVAADEDEDGEGTVTDQAPTTTAPTDDDIDLVALEAALDAMPILGRSALVTAAADIFEPDTALLGEVLELAAHESIKIDHAAVIAAAPPGQLDGDYFTAGLRDSDADLTRLELARLADTTSSAPVVDLAAALDDRPAFPRTGRADTTPDPEDQSLTDLQRITESLLEAMQ